MLFTVPLLDLVLLTSGIGAGGPSIPVITVATPMRCLVTLYPRTSEVVNASSGGGIPTLTARTASDHVLRIEDIVNDISGVAVVPDVIRYTVADSTGELVDDTITDPTNPDDWQIALSRSLFTPTRGPMTLTLTLVAPIDATETVLQFTLIQGVRQ
ncbi:MAG: hypothetical protein H7099_17555 [Gemmatimonadaceae bacterium]|nr:hypothetical protein [Gemmatimonadaceae bacterium]